VEFDPIVARKRSILQKTAHSMRLSLDNFAKKNKQPVLNAAIIVANEFPVEHIQVIAVMKAMGLNADNSVKGNLFEELKQHFVDKKKLNNAIKFAKYWESNEVKVRGLEALESKMS